MEAPVCVIVCRWSPLRSGGEQPPRERLPEMGNKCGVASAIWSASGSDAMTSHNSVCGLMPYRSLGVDYPSALVFKIDWTSAGSG